MDTRGYLHGLAVSVVLAASLAFGGCQKQLAVVNYQQVGACDGLSNLQGNGPGLGDVFFRIISIDNTKTNVDFTFMPGKMYLNSTDKFGGFDWEVTNQYTAALGLQPVKPSLVVPHGTATTVNRYAIFQVETSDPDGAKEANATSYFINYATDASDPGELMEKENSSQTSWPYTQTCGEIKFPNPILQEPPKVKEIPH
ncbi:MAG TPA: hypothetical protein VMB47_06260 [Candidatus Aquilonibacter sp.]|nr:hypothetical protein [Candidatus Aquilonibacter sp.]